MNSSNKTETPEERDKRLQPVWDRLEEMRKKLELDGGLSGNAYDIFYAKNNSK